MKRERDPRIPKALMAMENIGIAADKVKPVLRRLLKLYGNTWELIEDGNYRTLADAIFESEKEQQLETNDSATDSIKELPCKERNKSLPQQKLTMRSQPLKGDPGGEPSSSACSDRSKKAPITPSLPVTEGNRSEPHLQKSKSSHEYRDLGNGNGRKRRLEEPLDCIPYSALSSAPIGKYSETNVQAIDSGTTFHCTCDMVSSKCGQATISLSCKHAFGNSDFRSPNIDAVFKYVEESLLKSYKIISPKFSLVELLRYLCDSYIEFTTDSGRKSMAIKASGTFPPRLTENNERITCGSSSSNASNRPIVKQQAVIHTGKRVINKIIDIAKGTEKVNIMLLANLGEERRPEFMYIPQSIVYQSAQIHVSLARIVDDDCCLSCSGDCLSSSIPCECARDTGGEFAYTPDGLLTEGFLETCISMSIEPEKHYHFRCLDCPLERAKRVYQPEDCKGHLVKKFIKECWRKCGCNMRCGNRVVQRGIIRKLQVFIAEEGKGWGLRTAEEIPKGAFVCEYVGEILTNMELYERNQSSSGNGRHTYPVLLDADWGSEGVLKDEEALCLDATYYGNVARFINHRCFDANLIDIPVEVETPDHHYYHLAFFTKRKIEAFEELTWDYRIDFDDHNHPIEAFQCCCSSLYCRDKKGERAKMTLS